MASLCSQAGQPVTQKQTQEDTTSIQVEDVLQLLSGQCARGYVDRSEQRLFWKIYLPNTRSKWILDLRGLSGWDNSSISRRGSWLLLEMTTMLASVIISYSPFTGQLYVGDVWCGWWEGATGEQILIHQEPFWQLQKRKFPFRFWNMIMVCRVNHLQTLKKGGYTATHSVLLKILPKSNLKVC